MLFINTVSDRTLLDFDATESSSKVFFSYQIHFIFTLINYGLSKTNI